MRSTRLLLVMSVLGACALACGSSTSQGAVDGSVTAPDAAAYAPYPLASLDDVCDGGPTGRELLSFVRSSYAGTYAPPGSRPSAPAWTGPTTPSALTMIASYAGGAILCTPKHPFNCPAGAPCAQPPPAKVSVELKVVVKTADGTLDETLTATAEFEKGMSAVNWTATLLGTDLQGSYPISAGPKASTHLAMNGRFQGATVDGQISEMTTQISFSGGSWTATESPTDGGVDAPTD